jgi:hypothetical protein
VARAERKATKAEERVAENLERLRLKKIAELFPTYCERAGREDLSHLSSSTSYWRPRSRTSFSAGFRGS